MSANLAEFRRAQPRWIAFEKEQRGGPMVATLLLLLVLFGSSCGERALLHHPAGKEAFQFSRPHRMLKLADRLRLHLPDALAGDFEYSPDFFQRVRVAVAYAVAELDNLA